MFLCKDSVVELYCFDVMTLVQVVQLVLEEQISQLNLENMTKSKVNGWANGIFKK